MASLAIVRDPQGSTSSIPTVTGPVQVSDVVTALHELRRRRDRALCSVLSAQLRVVDFCWDRYERTGEQRWLDAATAADRMYLQLRERVVS